jgi:hypothetical protein
LFDEEEEEDDEEDDEDDNEDDDDSNMDGNCPFSVPPALVVAFRFCVFDFFVDDFFFCGACGPLRRRCVVEYEIPQIV